MGSRAEKATFWVGVAGTLGTIAALGLVVGTVNTSDTHFREPWFGIGVGAGILAVIALAIGLIMYFLHGRERAPGGEIDIQAQDQQPTTAQPSDEDVALDEDHEKLLVRLYEYEGKCAISAPTGEYECLWVPGFVTSMQWGWERTPQEAAISGKPRGNRTERMHWLFVVKDLVERGFLQETSTPQVFELTTDGQRLAYTLDRARQQ
jgi:hypothetical protein